MLKGGTVAAIVNSVAAGGTNAICSGIVLVVVSSSLGGSTAGTVNGTGSASMLVLERLRGRSLSRSSDRASPHFSRPLSFSVAEAPGLERINVGF